jgi:hypothetical protein
MQTVALIKEVCKSLMYASVAVLVCVAVVIALDAKRDLPEFVKAQRAELLKDLSSDIRDSETAILDHVSGWMNMADQRLGSLEATTDKHLLTVERQTESLHSDALVEINKIAAQTQQVVDLAQGVKPTLDSVAVIAADLQKVSENHIREKGNGAAWPVKITGMMGEFSKTSDSIRRAADAGEKVIREEVPPTAAAIRKGAESGAGVAGDAKRTADSISDWVEFQTQPKAWWKQLLDQVKAWALIVSKVLML